MTFSLYFYFFFSVSIFFMGLIGLTMISKNSFLMLISLEILFFSMNMNFILASIFLEDIFGSMFALFMIAVSGAEMSMGLALFILVHRFSKSLIAFDFINLKG